jgi:hypothetical protein
MLHEKYDKAGRFPRDNGCVIQYADLFRAFRVLTAVFKVNV